MSVSPIKQLGKAERFRERAKKRSKRLGETQDYAYEDPKVQKNLAKAKEAEKPKPQVENDYRTSASYERPDMPPVNYGSPLNSAYASGAGGMQYVSTAGAFQRLQDQIFKGVEQNLANVAAKKAAEQKRDDAANLSDKEWERLYGKKKKKKKKDDKKDNKKASKNTTDYDRDYGYNNTYFPS